MESGAGSGEDGAAPESWTTLVREGCGEEAGAVGEPGATGEVGLPQAVGAGAVAAEPVREAEARQAGGEASLGAELVVLVEDTMAAPDLGAAEDEGDEGREEREEVKEDAEDEGKHIEGVECPEEAEEGDEEAAAEGQGAEEVKEEGERDDKEESVEEEAKEEDEQLKEEEEPGGDSVEEGAKAEEAKEEDFEEQVAEDVEAEEEEDKREEAREESQKEEAAQELQEKQEGEEQRGARPGPPRSPLQALQALQALQSELEPVNKDASRAYSRLKLRFWQRRRRHLEHRSTLIRGIPGFWAKAFVNHPQMSGMISGQDKGILGSMADLKVEELESPRDGRKILLFFRKNSYFRNEVVEKEYVLRAAGYEPSHSTAIQWHRNYEREAYRRRHHNSSLNFFNWFSDHSFAGSSRIAEIIMDDLWPNPLQYYVRKKAPAEGPERRAGSFKTLR